jgi:ribulose-phosphate 3-epimerase
VDLRRLRRLNYRIEIDGGVSLNTIPEIVQAGVEILVAGNAVFGNGDPKVNAGKLLKAATEASLLKA